VFETSGAFEWMLCLMVLAPIGIIAGLVTWFAKRKRVVEHHVYHHDE
jgi:hypothetical protein